MTNACYSHVNPTPVKSPYLVAWSRELAKQLGLSDGDCQSSEFLQTFSGNRLLEGMEPYAMCYGGHQFGHWAGQLGDGRAINLGEVFVTSNQSTDNQRMTLQLKGSGETPYSRSADGLAVMRSSIREFLCSEAMHHLGVPTTRALSIVGTGKSVMRDMFYDGRPAPEPGAIVCRVAPSFLRFGNFEIHAARQELDLLRQLADYTIDTFFPHLHKLDHASDADLYLSWFDEVCRTTLDMIVGWMRVGFVHGVMNTDNMSIHGLTIDYGPYGWLDNYDPDWTPNTTDAQGRRYRYANQPGIAQWNLLQLANALFPLIQQAEPLQQRLSMFAEEYSAQWQIMFAEKLGLQTSQVGDQELVDDLVELISATETDMTLFFRQLGELEAKNSDLSDQALFDQLGDSFYAPDSLTRDFVDGMLGWIYSYRRRLQSETLSDEERRQSMHKVNPKYVLRNYLAQLAIDKAEQMDFSLVNELLEVLRYPYDDQPGKERFAEKRPEWARSKPGCSMLSCSS